MPRQKKLAELILLTLCALTILLTNAFAEPISSPEIASKSIKLQANNNNNNLQQQQQQQQQHQQQSDAHLNSLTVYATNYDNIASAQAHGQPSAATSSASNAAAAGGGAGTSSAAAAALNQTPNSHFKPSYRLPEMETNFTPLHSQSSPASLANLQSTPMLMQYLPAHSLQDGSAGGSPAGGGGIQYLQLIPTRPIIVPISPYLAPNGAPPPPSAYASLAPTVGASAGNTLSDYAQPPTLAGTHRGVSAGAGGLMPFANAAGLHAYANTIVPYRPTATVGGAAPGHPHHFHRFNREAKDKHYPHTMSLNLNLNEYLPAAHEATARAGMGLGGAHLYMRGRP